MTKDQEYERIISSFIEGTRILVPKWFQTRRGVHVPTPSFHYEWEDLILAEKPDGTALYPKLSFRAPRGHAKSTIISKSFNLWRIIMSACVELLDEYVVIGSASGRQSLNWFRSIVDNIEHNEKIKYYFGKPQRGRYWRYGDGDVVLAFNTNGAKRQIRLRAAGADMEIRGDQEDNVRPTIFTLDDITKDKESRTEGGRQSRVDWVLSSVIPALDPEGRVINVGTPRPYEDDWNSGVIEKLADSSVSPEQRWHLVTYKAIPDMADPEAPVLWPERHSREKLIGILESWKRIGKEHLWWSEYQCQVVSPGTQAFPREWFEPFRWDGHLVRHPAGPYLQTVKHGRKPVNTFVGIDSAFSRARKADHTVISCWGMDEDRNWWQIEEIRRRGMPSPEAVREAVLMGARNQARYIMFERVGAQQALAEFAEEKMKQLKHDGNLDHYMDIKDYPPGNRNSKEDRIKTALQTPYSLGRVHHKTGIHHNLENELDNFPAVHPDCLDSQYYAFIEAFTPSHRAPKNWAEDERSGPLVEHDWLTGRPKSGEKRSNRARTNRKTP